MRARDASGFTLVELLVATAMTLAVTGAALALAQPAQATLRSQLDHVDARQRMRVAVDALIRDLTLAGSGLPSGSTPLAGYAGPRGEAGLTIRFADPASGVVTSHSYYVLVTDPAEASELRRWNGTSVAPVADGIESVTFNCADGTGDAVGCGSPDVRRVRMTLSAHADAGPLRVSIDVAPRCLQSP